jgi:hypothetical protein
LELIEPFKNDYRRLIKLEQANVVEHSESQPIDVGSPVVLAIEKGVAAP